MDKNELSKWITRLRESDNEIERKIEQWQTFRRFFRGKLPPQVDRTRQFQAKTFVHIVQPRVFAFTAREMMYVFGSPDSITIEISGKRTDKKLELLEDRAQAAFNHLLSDSRRFLPQANAVQDKYIYGNCGLKVLPLLDSDDQKERDRIFRDEVILPWMFLFDSNASYFDKSPWAGHDVVLPRDYLLEKDYYDKEALKRLSETKNPYAQKLNLRDERGGGILVTEVWDKTTGKMFAIGNRAELIREPIDFPYDVFPYIWGQAFGESNMPYGFGLGDILKWVQYYAVYLKCQRMNNLMKAVHNMLVVPQNGISIEDLKNPKPGGFIRVQDMSQAPQPLNSVDVTRTIEEEVMIEQANADNIIGLSPYAQAQMPSKRTVTAEVAASLQGSGQGWYAMKLAEGHQYVPWAEIVTKYLSYAPDDYFDRLVSRMGPLENKDEYVEVGHLIPSMLREYSSNIVPKMAANVMNDFERRREIAEFVNLVGSVAPNYLKLGEVFDLLRSTYRTAGMKNILKSEEEIQAERQQFNDQLAERIAGLRGGGGSVATPPLR